MELRCYSLSVPIKRKLGTIIKVLRKQLLEETREINLIDNNPFTKANFSHNICHFHTLTKLENDYIREDFTYHTLLDKLGLYFQVREEIHEANMLGIRNLALQYLNALEFSERKYDEEIEARKQVVQNDCIAILHLELLEFSNAVFFWHERNLKLIKKFESLIDIFDALFQGIACQAIGFGYFRNGEYTLAESYLNKAIEKFQVYNFNIGLTHFPLISLYTETSDYYKAINVCNLLEEYYIKTNNRKRLITVYLCLIDYYLFINSLDFAQKYTDEITLLLKADDSYYKWLLYYKWGVYELSNLNEKIALEYFKQAFRICEDDGRKLNIINRILICSSTLKLRKEEMYYYLDAGYNYYHKGNEVEKGIFTYFINKFSNRTQYNKYVHNSLMPVLKTQPQYKIIDLFFYRDMYNK